MLTQLNSFIFSLKSNHKWIPQIGFAIRSAFKLIKYKWYYAAMAKSAEQIHFSALINRSLVHHHIGLFGSFQLSRSRSIFLSSREMCFQFVS